MNKENDFKHILKNNTEFKICHDLKKEIVITQGTDFPAILEIKVILTW